MSNDASAKNKKLIVYQFYEKDQSYLENLIHFLIFGYSKTNDYIILVSGKLGFKLPQFENLEVMFVDNYNSDYGAISTLINRKKEEIFAYEFVLFFNSSVRGPFVPPAFECDWTEAFTTKLKDNIGIVGSTINIISHEIIYSLEYQKMFGGNGPFSTVQTMTFALQGNMIKRLYEDSFFAITEELSKSEIITKFEIHLSQKVISYGYNLGCLLPEYNRIDYRMLHSQINPTGRNGDPAFGFGYFGRTPHPYETLFTKTNRDVCSTSYLDRLAFSMLNTVNLEKNMYECIPAKKYIEKITSNACSSEAVYMEAL